MMNDGVRFFLENLGMQKYYDIFCAKGFDLESDIPYISPSDLEDSMMIESHKDRTFIYHHAQKFQPSPKHTLYEWLHKHSLDHYFINFIQSELIDLNVVAEIQLPNEDLYDELEIVMPGHKKRLERAVANLREERGRNAPAEVPITQGWWGKPDCLPQAKFDFLCVTANLFASHEPDKKAEIDFMVDSGSDVSTVQEKTLENLNLDLIGRVYSCGIHGGNYTNLYKAQLEVGDEKLDIEVMASNYDSLGSRIVRHFRHVIDGKRHIWLRGNYKDPLPAIMPLKMPNAKSTLDSGMKSLEYKPLAEPIHNESKSAQLHPSLQSSLSSSSSSSSSSENLGLSLSSEEKVNVNITKNNAKSQDSSATPSQLDSILQSSNPNSVTHTPQHDNSKQRKSGESANYTTAFNNGKNATSNGFIPLSLLSTSKVGQLRVHPQISSSKDLYKTVDKTEETINIHTLTASNSNIPNYSVDANTVSSRDDKKSCKDIKSSDCMDGKLSNESFTDAKEVVCKTEDVETSLLTNITVSSGSAGLKRHTSSPLNGLGNCEKLPKMCENDQTIPQALKDTDDDIDHMNNPFYVEHSNPFNFNSHQAVSHSNSSNSDSYRHLLDFGREPNALCKIVNTIGSEMEKDTREEVIHILSENDNMEEESFLSSHEMNEKGLESMGINSNFMPGLGISVMIPMDDLEKS